MGKQTLESWIHEAMVDSDKDGMITMFSLMHIGAGEKEIHSVKFGSKPWSASEISQLFRHKGESYSQDIPGVQTFIIYAFYAGRNEPQAQHPFTVNGATDFGLSTEGPDEKGMKQQWMRHYEAGNQMALRSLGLSVDSQGRLIDRLLTDNLEQRKENRELIGLLKDVILTQANQNHERDMKKLEYERSTKERERWIGFLPGLVNNILGKEVFPQHVEDTAHLQAIADAMDEDDLKKLAGKVKPEQLGPLANRFKKHFSQKKTEENNTKQLAAKNPEDDAVGD